MAEPSDWNGDAPETKYDPSSVEVDRGRQQGLGVGARDLARQRDPSVPTAAEDDDSEGDDEAADAAPDAADNGG